MSSPTQEGVIYVAYGEPAMRACRMSIEVLRRNNDYPVAVIQDMQPSVPANVISIYHPDEDLGGRVAKLKCDQLSPFEYTAYLDADTLPYGNISAGFEMLKDGWEMVIAPSMMQDGRAMWHIEADERQITVDELGYEPVLQLQGGVIFFRKCAAVRQFFTLWREEWRRWQDKDQAALLRALRRSPVKVWLLGQSWNGGEVIAHRFGTAARKEVVT